MKNHKFSVAALALLISLFSAQNSSAQLREIPGRGGDRGGWDDGRGGRDDRGRDDGRGGRGDDRGRWDDRRPGYDRLVTIYRLFNGQDHMMSPDRYEGSYQGYRAETSVQLFADGSRTRSPLFRCYMPANGNHFTSNQAGCEGHQTEFILGYVEARPTRNAQRALYRCYNGFEHMTTVDARECNRGGYTVEGPQGFIP